MIFGTITPERLPRGFRYPVNFEKFCTATPAADIKPWFILDSREDADIWLDIVQEWYPERCLIPFAQHIVTGDDIACFDGNDRTGDPEVHLVHSFASAGWEDRGSVANFEAWLAFMEEDRQEYLQQRAEDAAYEAELAAAENGKKKEEL
jgi:hypothetical protein